MKKLTMLMTLSIMLTACSSKEPVKPTVVTEYEIIKEDVPNELLEVTPAPKADTLKGVKICEGEKKLRAYGIALIRANYTNSQKLKALQRLLK